MSEVATWEPFDHPALHHAREARLVIEEGEYGLMGSQERRILDRLGLAIYVAAAAAVILVLAAVIWGDLFFVFLVGVVCFSLAIIGLRSEYQLQKIAESKLEAGLGLAGGNES